MHFLIGNSVIKMGGLIRSINQPFYCILFFKLH